MKIIDILNKIANGEEVPKKIIIDDKIYIFDKEAEEYISEDKENVFIGNKNGLNQEVKILETTITYKPDKIEKLNYCELTGEDIFGVDNIPKRVTDKINEIIEVINER